MAMAMVDAIEMTQECEKKKEDLKRIFVRITVSLSVGDRPALPLLKQQFSISELIACRGDGQNHMVGSEETGLQDHTDENCLYCVGAMVLGYPTQPQINSTHPRAGEQSHTH